VLRIEPAPVACLAPGGHQSLTPSHLVVLRAALADPIETFASESRAGEFHGAGGRLHLVDGVPDINACNRHPGRPAGAATTTWSIQLP